ncbi:MULTISPECIES: membrane protein insertion efficiency factor YidD [unclassified Cupriavidus]|uniref:membrane protein insertion efficiency factor YidD n=2 Tax=Cupriavidus TaxID=106589 RepID=UPI001365727A|nr:membrane protein insertion efficiency factor YidD [Cupriavidus sp. SW-Y-13]MWL85836.1 membrane protein insertion efficiency factor YidD [Cupriavidus sp. SW-Y-13]
MKRILLALLRVYKIALSPYLGSQCRFLPTCSDYARDAIASHGPARGTWMAACRLCRCHPFAKGGYDPVPEPAVNGKADAAPRASAAPGRPPVTVRLPRP